MKEIYIDLGCGDSKKPDCIGIDKSDLESVDIVFDLEKGIPLDSNSVDGVFTSHFIEHISEPMYMIEEIHRVLKPEGFVSIVVPHWSWFGSHTFMHKRFFHSRDFDMFDKSDPYNYYTNVSFSIIHKEIRMNKGSGKWYSVIFNKIINSMLNWNHNFSEQFLVNIFMPEDIIILMEKT